LLILKLLKPEHILLIRSLLPVPYNSRSTAGGNNYNILSIINIQPVHPGGKTDAAYPAPGIGDAGKIALC
jgi:hypothetical protein